MIALALVLVLASSPEASTPRRDGPPAVQVTVAGPGAQTQDLVRALPEFMRELGAPTRFSRVDALELEAVVSPRASPSPAPARVWIDIADPTRARIIVIDAAYERVLVRTVALEDGLDEVARDEIGYIVQASVEALLAGGQIGISRDVAAEQLGVPSGPSAPAAAPTLSRPRPGAVAEVALGYGARAWGPVAPLHGPLFDVGVGAGLGALDLGGALEAQLLIPIVVPGERLSLALTGASLRALARADLRLGGRWSFDVAAGGGVDLMHDRARADAVGASAFAPRTRVVGDLALRLGPAVRVGSGRDRLVVRVDATVDVALRSYRYVTADTGEVVLDPWVARPGLRLTLGWSRRAPQPASKQAGYLPATQAASTAGRQ